MINIIIKKFVTTANLLTKSITVSETQTEAPVYFFHSGLTCVCLFYPRYKSNVYRATVEIITSADKVQEFCKEVCRKLQVCPYLFSTEQVGPKTCPENCHTLSKTRFCE